MSVIYRFSANKILFPDQLFKDKDGTRAKIASAPDDMPKARALMLKDDWHGRADRGGELSRWAMQSFGAVELHLAEQSTDGVARLLRSGANRT